MRGEESKLVYVVKRKIKKRLKKEQKKKEKLVRLIGKGAWPTDATSADERIIAWPTRITHCCVTL
jgi:hypothetical protein